MTFLHPEFALFGILGLLFLLFQKKRKFTHLHFFKNTKSFSVDIVDLFILIFLTLSLMYPVKYTTKYITSKVDYQFYNNKKEKIIIILDDSLSMEDYVKLEKSIALNIIENNKAKADIMLVIFEGDYKILSYFTDNYDELKKQINDLYFNAVTGKGGSMLRDTISGVINAFKPYNPKIYILTDGSPNDESSVSVQQLKKLANGMQIKYIGFGDDKNNKIYEKIFNNTKLKKYNPVSKYQEKTKVYSYQEEEFFYWFLVAAFMLMIYKIIRLRFENFNFGV
ncbi:vWA domain-containing protein [Caminibacter pacificus]